MRKLVTIQRVKNIVPIANADAIELAKVLGWQCVVKKGEFQVGDRGVYFEVDSFLPVDDSRYEFLRNNSCKNNEFMGEGFRIKTQKLRGELSQGLLLPLSDFPELEGYEDDVDVSDVLRVQKWEIPEIIGSDGVIIGDKPFGIPTTDETRIQSIDTLRTQLLGKAYYISTKMDGTSCTMYYIDGKFGVCGRSGEYKDDGKCPMWEYAKKKGFPEKFASLGYDIVLQGEFCGPRIQKNRLQLKEVEWFVFNYLNPEDMRLKTLDEMMDICSKIGANTVPIEEKGDSFNYTLEELLERAKGKYKSGQHKEGIVIRPLIPEYSKDLGKELSFKVLNNDFLLKEK